MNYNKEIAGEFLGTFILVFIGCGAVGAAVILHILTALWQVAAVFGIGVTLGILASANWSPAHLNPAVSIAFWINGGLPAKKLPSYFLAQFTGAFAAAAALYLPFRPAIEALEKSTSIVRGSSDSIKMAMMFGEYFPNPDFPVLSVNVWQAMLTEGFGTFLLVLTIFLLVTYIKKYTRLIPWLIGYTVFLLIIFLAPYTQGGFNPARDFAPRLFSYFAGWGELVFQPPHLSFFTVYMLSPVLGAVLAALLYKRIQK